eukprot:9762007-Alexandrium_andersonii.AAC.1
MGYRIIHQKKVGGHIQRPPRPRTGQQEHADRAVAAVLGGSQREAHGGRQRHAVHHAGRQ